MALARVVDVGLLTPRRALRIPITQRPVLLVRRDRGEPVASPAAAGEPVVSPAAASYAAVTTAADDTSPDDASTVAAGASPSLPTTASIGVESAEDGVTGDGDGSAA